MEILIAHTGQVSPPEASGPFHCLSTACSGAQISARASLLLHPQGHFQAPSFPAAPTLSEVCSVLDMDPRVQVKPRPTLGALRATDLKDQAHHRFGK